jgi:hypothetical protein
MTVVPGPRGFYQHYGFTEIHERPHLLVNARASALPHSITEVEIETPWRIVSGWPMPIGRYTSSRQEWERHKMITYHLPELGTCLHKRLRIKTEHAEAIAILAQHSPFDNALVAHAWTKNMPINDLVAILRSECAKSGYTQVRLLIDPEIVHEPIIAEPVEQAVNVCMVRWLQERMR